MPPINASTLYILVSLCDSVHRNLLHQVCYFLASIVQAAVNRRELVWKVMWCLKRYLLLSGNDEDIVILMKMPFIRLKRDCLQFFSNVIVKWWYKLQSFGLIPTSSWLDRRLFGSSGQCTRSTAFSQTQTTLESCTLVIWCNYMDVFQFRTFSKRFCCLPTCMGE